MNNIYRAIIAATIIVVSIANPTAAYCSEQSDSLKTTNYYNDYQFKSAQLVLPVSLMAVGTYGVYNTTMKKYRDDVKDGMEKLRGDHYFHADDYVQYLPMAAYLGLGAIGAKAKHPFRERFVAGATAYLSLGIITNVAKHSFKEKRPDTNARNSFPSGHTATVFMGAELMRIEYGNYWGLGAYTVATAVGFLRMYNNRHWFNDVLAGAGVGIISARIGYWMLPLWRKWFKWDKNLQVVAMPSYDIYTNTLSVGFAACF
ncbi:MAG: phosphatase PAP2 family protein [Muribaculaceae bacterium]|nr:phosphatase PAP2 family protein [Muribaculaceae bacterium]